MRSTTMNRGYGLGILFLLLLPVLLFIAYHSFSGSDGTEGKAGKFSSSEALSLPAHLEQAIGIEAPGDIYEKAIAYAVKNLAVELDISLENYDLSLEDYQAIVEAAGTKFGDCHQYKLYALAPSPYSCYTCVSRPKVILKEGQTFKIGQTCGTRASRYGRQLPEPGLVYFTEIRGNLFEVMVAEYVKLLLFQYSKERLEILKQNNLSAGEMQLPPGNKILR